MRVRLLSITIAAFYGVQLVSAYAIFTTTILFDTFEGTIETPQPASNLPASTLPASQTKPLNSAPALATPAPFSNDTITSSSTSTSNASIPNLPLSNDQSDAFTSFLNLLTSIPDNVLSAGEDGVKDFFANISSCVSGDSKALEDTIASQLPKLSSLAHEVGDKITSAAGAGASVVKSGVSKATSLAGVGASAVESGASSLVSAGESAVAPVISKVSSAAAPAITEATSAVASVVSGAVPKITSLAGDLGKFGKGFGLKREPADAGDILKEVGQVTACLSNAVTTNQIFQVGKCAADLASIAKSATNFAADLIKLKKLTVAVGGAVKAIQGLKNAKSAGDVVKSGGNALLDLLKGVADVTGATQDCAFLVQRN